MFTVYEKSTNEEVKVYDVQHNNYNYPQFLIYEDNEWRYISSKYYMPHKDLSNYIPMGTIEPPLIPSEQSLFVHHEDAMIDFPWFKKLFTKKSN